jgi:hypothetical protein
MDRDHRLEFEDVLRAVVRPDTEVGVVLERQDGKIADRILRFLGDIRFVGLADGIVVDARAGGLVFVGRRLMRSVNCGRIEGDPAGGALQLVPPDWRHRRRPWKVAIAGMRGFA